ncbi:MAG: GNAT family N-acetyltransferase [Rhodobacteraceae bacterium]|nr:GNAT family N-acetyltransferase [Alphaproteobacteria bacterium]NNK67038.1 GNAT family N-acetyltransferase [Paracoccaceae bacterium]
MSKTADTQGGPVIKTARLTLRAARQSDLTDLHAVYADPRAMRYWSNPPHPDLSVTQAWLDSLIASSDPYLSYFVFEYEGRAIGTGGMHKPYEVGFILHSDFWRMGLGREAMTAINAYLFDTNDTAELTADADPRNAASVELLKSLGFVETGRAENTFCVNGEWSDSVYFALPRPKG